ncbi:T9SS type A sorting domain-containing protein [Flavobacterium ajazii]|uniref:T9SS type A sorting domain-containing protein n=1 Tax=Flavobacterium ajazii TaxID=2692318 RepID=UPI0013D2AC9C|nr:T9SS type A sorting domain-containing protein [Flavobacterium ajazii]
MHKKVLVLMLFPVLMYAQSNSGTTNKVTRYFYDDKVTSVEIWYGSDNKMDSLKTYHSNGKLNEVFYYDEKGLKNSNSYQYDMQGEKRVTWNFLHGKLMSRVDHKLPFNKDSEETMKKMLQTLADLNAKTNYNPVKITDIAKRGYLRARLGNTSLAIEDLKRVEYLMNKISKKTTDLPDSEKAKREKFKSNIYDVLGNLYMSLEMEDHAFHHFYKAMASAPDDYRILYNFANCLQNRKQNDLALFYLEKILKEKPEHGHARWSIAKLYSDLGQYEKAMENINVAFTKEKTIIEHSSGYGGRDLRTTRGLLYHKLGDSEKGIQDLKAALGMDKNNTYALKNLGIIYLDQKKHKEACELFQKAKELNYSLIFDENDLDALLESACNNVVPEIIQKKKAFVFPNPAVSSISIENFSSEKFNYALFDFESNPVLNGSTTNGTIDVSSLASGFYILKVSTDDISETFKVIKQ